MPPFITFFFQWLMAWLSLTNKEQNPPIVYVLFVGFFLYLPSIFNLGQVKFEYLINHAILKLNAYHHRLITISRGDAIYEMSLKKVYPQANRCQPPFCLNVSFAVNTETERYGLGAGSWCPHVVSVQGGVHWKGIDQCKGLVYSFLEA